jgi:hypothetical protein
LTQSGELFLLEWTGKGFAGKVLVNMGIEIRRECVELVFSVADGLVMAAEDEEDGL